MQSWVGESSAYVGVDGIVQEERKWGKKELVWNSGEHQDIGVGEGKEEWESIIKELEEKPRDSQE